MRNIDTRDLLDSITYTLREDYSSSLFNTTMSQRNIDNYIGNDLKNTDCITEKDIDNLSIQYNNYVEMKTMDNRFYSV